MKKLLLLLVLASAAPAQKASPTDDEIYDRVRRVLANDPDIKGGAFEVDVKNGVVLVKGKVVNEKFRLKVDKLVKKVKGVQRVENQVTVEP